jgi:predicted RNA methylase
MAGGRDHTAKQHNSQYFTDINDCANLLDIVHEHWDLDDKVRVLEPSAGCGSFPKACAFWDYPKLEWVTNELYPDGGNYLHDYEEDFLSDDFKPKGEFDLVIGNPPFSGKVNFRGERVGIATAFLRRSFEFVDRAAMILPANQARPYYRSLLPEGVQQVWCSEPSWVQFSTPEGESEVRVVYALYERTGENERKMHPLSESVKGFRFAKNYKEATHAICMWGAAGVVRQLSHNEFRSEKSLPWTFEIPVVLDDLWAEMFVGNDMLNEIFKDYSPLASSGLREEEVWDCVAEFVSLA